MNLGPEKKSENVETKSMYSALCSKFAIMVSRKTLQSMATERERETYEERFWSMFVCCWD